MSLLNCGSSPIGRVSSRILQESRATSLISWLVSILDRCSSQSCQMLSIDTSGNGYAYFRQPIHTMSAFIWMLRRRDSLNLLKTSNVIVIFTKEPFGPKHAWVNSNMLAAIQVCNENPFNTIYAYLCINERIFLSYFYNCPGLKCLALLMIKFEICWIFSVY